ncbi:MAG: SDR family oxidoreductase [Anaerolineaceae bacterium]|nr:SDR family oxidoreductase [Anaerolineaceae bacterium]
MDLNLTGKTALVTGSSRGLGFAVAHLLAVEGANIVINGRNPDTLEDARLRIEKETGSLAAAVTGDLSLPAMPAAIVKQAAEIWGGLDILVTNAGGPPPGSFESLDDDAWDLSIQLSLMSHVRLIRAALPYLKDSSAASVLAIASYSVKQPIPKLVLSNSVRSATIGLIKTLALEIGGQGIRFNAILPGWTNTERVTELLQARAAANGTTVQQEMDQQMLDSPLGRMATPEEFANAAVFLTSPAASYITGHMLTVDGGMYKGTF